MVRSDQKVVACWLPRGRSTDAPDRDLLTPSVLTGNKPTVLRTRSRSIVKIVCRRGLMDSLIPRLYVNGPGGTELCTGGYELHLLALLFTYQETANSVKIINRGRQTQWRDVTPA